MIMTWKDDLANVGLRQSVIRQLRDILVDERTYTLNSIKKSLQDRGIKRLNSANLRRYLDNADWVIKRQTNIKSASVVYGKRV